MLPYTQQISRRPIPKTSWLFQSFGCGYPYEFLSSKKFVYTLSQHFWDTENYIILIFSFYKKLFLTKPNWNNLWISIIYFVKDFWDPLRPLWSVGYQNRVKRVCGEDVSFNIFEKCQILRPFSFLATWNFNPSTLPGP